MFNTAYVDILVNGTLGEIYRKGGKGKAFRANTNALFGRWFYIPVYDPRLVGG